MIAMKRPVKVRCEQYVRHAEMEEDFIIDAVTTGTIYAENGRIYVETGTGAVEVEEGAYVMQGVEGELYPCSEDIFDRTYEVLDEKEI